MNRTSKRPMIAAALSGGGVEFLVAPPSAEESSEEIRVLDQDPEELMKAVTDPIVESLKQEIAKVDVSRFKGRRLPEDLDAGE